MREFYEIHILVMSPKQKIFEPFQKPFFVKCLKKSNFVYLPLIMIIHYPSYIDIEPYYMGILNW